MTLPIKHALWLVGKPPRRLPESALDLERALEEMIENDSDILSEDWMLIGRQLRPAGRPLDLLAVAPDGTLIIAELKRDRTAREVVTQALDYAASIAELTPSQVIDNYARYKPGRNLRDDFRERFGVELDEDSLNSERQIVIVAAESDPVTERITRYLSERGIPINMLYFQVFTTGNEQLLSRAWLLDPVQVQVDAAAEPRGEREPWNHEFYVSFGAGSERNWDEARRYGFVCAGGGKWYSQTLNMLGAGDRIWVNIPRRGYVGVARVQGTPVRLKDFEISVDGKMQPALSVLSEAHYHRQFEDDDDRSEYFVPVEWLDAVPEDKAFSETGFFGNQNSVCQPRAAKWRHTVEQLKQRFTHWNS